MQEQDKKVSKGRSAAKRKPKPGEEKRSSVGVVAGKKRPRGATSATTASKRKRDDGEGEDLARKLNKLGSSIQRMDKTKAERDAEVLELYNLLKTKFLKYSARHDLCRCIQCCFRFGTEEMRNTILTELQGKMVNLSKGKYSCFLVNAFLRYGNEKQRGKVLNEFRGHMSRLSTHNCGSVVLDFAFSSCDIDAKKRKKNKSKTEESAVVPVKSILKKLKTELYGTEFAMFANDGSNDDTDAYTKLDLKKRRVVLANLSRIATKQAEKGILRFPFAHWIMYRLITLCEMNIEEFKDEAKEERAIIEAMTPLVTEACLAMLTSHDGAASVARFIAHSSAKERKKLVRMLKGHVKGLCFHEDGYLVLLTLLNVIDDTVLLNKTIMPEMVSSEVLDRLVQSCVTEETPDLQARLVFLQIYSPCSSRYLTNQDCKLITAAPGTSKKDGKTRALELQKQLNEPLVEACKGHVDKLLIQQRGADILVELVQATWSTDLIAEIEECLKESPVALLEHPVAHRALKRLITLEGSKESDVASRLLKALSGKLPELVSINRACFVIAALLEHPLAGAAAKASLKPLDGKIAKLKTPGSAVLRKAFQNKL